MAAAREWPGHASQGNFPIRDDFGAQEALEALLERLGSSGSIKSVEDLDEFLHSEFAALKNPEGKPVSFAHLFAEDNMRRALSQIAQRLLSPSCTWVFSVPIAAGSQLPIAYALGGRNNLRLELRSVGESFSSVLLSGELDGPTPNRVRFLAEDLVRCTVGACFALSVMAPIPQPAALCVTLDLQGAGGIQIPLHPSVGGLLPHMFLHLPTNLDSLEERLAPEELVDRRLRSFGRVVSTTSPRTMELRNGAALLFDALAARDEGSAVAFALMSMEAVLLEKSDSASTVARLAEAVAYRLGASAEQRSIYRSAVKDLYNTRSTFVHTGRLDPKKGSRDDAIFFAKQVLYRELLGFAEA